MTFLSKSLPLSNKSIVLNMETKNQNFVLREVSINLSRYDDLFSFKIIATLPFRKIKTLLGEKKT